MGDLMFFAIIYGSQPLSNSSSWLIYITVFFSLTRSLTSLGDISKGPTVFCLSLSQPPWIHKSQLQQTLDITTAAVLDLDHSQLLSGFSSLFVTLPQPTRLLLNDWLRPRLPFSLTSGLPTCHTTYTAHIGVKTHSFIDGPSDPFQACSGTTMLTFTSAVSQYNGPC